MEAGAAFGDDAGTSRRCSPTHDTSRSRCSETRTGTWCTSSSDGWLQRRRQKLLEESPSPAIDAVQRAAWTDAALRIARAVGYQNARTVEFLLDRSGSFYFIEMNTRIQVEHPVTELVTGVDLVAEQLRHCARRAALGAPGRADVQRGGRRGGINAEDPERGFFPSPGNDHRTGAAHRTGCPGRYGRVRRGTGLPLFLRLAVREGDLLGRDRDEAIARMRCTRGVPRRGNSYNDSVPSRPARMTRPYPGRRLPRRLPRAPGRGVGQDAATSAGGRPTSTPLPWADDRAGHPPRAVSALGQRWATRRVRGGRARAESVHRRSPRGPRSHGADRVRVDDGSGGAGDRGGPGLPPGGRNGPPRS